MLGGGGGADVFVAMARNEGNEETLNVHAFCLKGIHSLA